MTNETPRTDAEISNPKLGLTMLSRILEKENQVLLKQAKLLLEMLIVANASFHGSPQNQKRIDETITLVRKELEK